MSFLFCLELQIDKYKYHQCRNTQGCAEQVKVEAALNEASVGSGLMLAELLILGRNDFLLGSLPDFNPKEYPCSYPRLKKMADGSFILFYMPQSHGSSIYYTISEDLLS